MTHPRRPVIALNMTTLVQGGVLQRAVSFIDQLQRDPGDFEWRLLVSPRVERELRDAAVTPRQPLTVHGPSPARDRSQRRRIAAEIHALRPDLVFTFAGPSYLRLALPQLMGVADGWVTHAGAEAYASIPSRSGRWRLWAASRYKRRWFRDAAAYVVQTETARRGLAARLPCDAARIHVIPNACGPWYRERSAEPPRRVPDRAATIFYFAAQYAHKRHDLIPPVAARLRAMGRGDVRFLITLPPEHRLMRRLESLARRLEVAAMIENLGPVPVSAGAGVYERAELCFVPSVLETFSATYVESMAAGVPIVTSDLPFAREVCGAAAEYFPAARADRAAEVLARLADDPQRRAALVAEGRRQLEQFPSPEAQQAQYYALLRRVLAGPPGD